MCGIAGYLEPDVARTLEQHRERIESMRDTLIHRGPDDAGFWIDETRGVALGHRRLSVLDLSSQGHQPMISRDGRYVMVYNGEVYNHLDLRQRLSKLGHSFSGSSDTEVLLAAFLEWTPESTLSRLNGMFALALWDRKFDRLLLARDRFGKKPLYYGKVGGAWVFGSELKLFRAIPEFSGELDLDALCSYVRFGYVPTPMCIHKGLKKLEPGHYLWLSESGSPLPYGGWDPEDLGLEAALKKAVERRMLSDVPVGAFLSGGIDSSLIVALMQEASSRPVKTFSLGFAESGYNEAVFAKRVAERLGTDHTEHYLGASEALGVIPKLATMYDEPFADSSQIPTFLISRLARTQVTVVLTGDGGDELFGGYNRYLWGPRVWSVLRRVPLFFRRQTKRLLESIPLATRWKRLHEKLTKVLELLALDSDRAIYKALVSPWRLPETVVRQGRDLSTKVDTRAWDSETAECMMKVDADTYLPDDILVKVDRASMACSLEARCPFLDPEVAYAASKMTLQQKISSGLTKRPLRGLLYQRLPAELFERPKSGFGIPLGQWLRGELRPWAEELLARIPEQPYFHPDPISRRWREHQSGHRDWSASLWVILIFQDWLANLKDRGAGR